VYGGYTSSTADLTSAILIYFVIRFVNKEINNTSWPSGTHRGAEASIMNSAMTPFSRGQLAALRIYFRSGGGGGENGVTTIG
jgi:hypothetical protein